MIKLIASDLDGTMFEKGNVIPETNLKAINDINNSNINFTICTGKTYSLFKNICQDIGTGYGIFGNGNQIINLKTGEEIYRKLLKNEDVLFCINTAKKLNLHVHLYTNKEVITEKLLYMDLRNFELTKNDKNIDLEFKIVTDIQKYVKRENPEILKLVISAEKDLASLKKEFAKNKNLQVNLIRKVDKYRDEIIGKEYEFKFVTTASPSTSSRITFSILICIYPSGHSKAMIPASVAPYSLIIFCPKAFWTSS